MRLLGATQALAAEHTISRWPSRAVATLLARLALEPDRAHSREELVELLWPAVALDVGRNRLRQALSTLKGLLEPPGPQAIPVLRADRLTIGVLPGMIECDAREFERLARTAGAGGRARALYRGELMPGFDGEWIADERQRLAALYDGLTEAIPVSAELLVATSPAVLNLPQTDSPASVLPSYWTRAFGVEPSVDALCMRIGVQRLLTVLGPGGSGKTRLAVQTLQRLRSSGAATASGVPSDTAFDSIAFVSLIDCVGAVQALEAIEGALHIDSGPRTASSRLIASLGGQRTLLVLDNVEQIDGEAVAALERLLTALPGLHLLVTSRRRLGLAGEALFDLDGLPLPPLDADLAETAANPAVALFVDRAQAVRADFHLTARNAEAIATLVRLLGGVPLAIELAASRVRSLNPSALLQRLSENAGTPLLDLLVRSAPRASADTRHASMRHVVAWSWRQLDADQAALLQSLSIFPTPVRLAAVAAAAGVPVVAAQGLLASLRDSSLVAVAGSDDEGMTCYGLLQPVREFAAERCPPDDARAARARVRHWLTQFATEALHRGPATLAPVAALLHAAIVTAPDDRAAHEAVALALALRAYWDADHLPLSALQALERALDEVADAGERADLLELLSYGRGVTGFVDEAVRHAEAALAMPLDDRRRSLALTRWAWATYYAGQHEVPLDPALDEAWTLAQRAGDLVAQATALRMRSVVACNFRLEYALAEALSAQAQQLWERLGNRRMAYGRLLDRAVMWAWMGRNEDAVPVLLECERAALADRDWGSLMQVTWQLGRVYNRLRRWEDAAAAFRRGVRVGWQRHHSQGLANALLHLPEALVMCGQAPLAARLQGFAQSHWLRLFKGMNRIDARELRRTRLLLHRRLGTATFEVLRLEGSSLHVTQAVALALDDAAR